VRDPSGVVIKDPNQEVQDRVALVFNSFLQLRTARRVTRVPRERDLALPRNDRHGEAYWARPSVAAVTSMLKNPAYAGVFAYGRTHAREAAAPGGPQNQVRRPAGECRIVVRDRYCPAPIERSMQNVSAAWQRAADLSRLDLDYPAT
jgi:hypothetical protein